MRRVKYSKSRTRQNEHYFYAQIHSPVSGSVIRVRFCKGDKVKELVDLAVKKWGITHRKGWFPALFHEDWGYQLRLTDDIPTDAASFIDEHESEFAIDEEDAKERGLKKFRQYGDMLEGADINEESIKRSPEEVDADWASDDVHIELVAMITGG